MPSDGPMCILDPCAGEGVAIAEASHALGREQTKAFAVEFDAERARHARGLVDHCLHADLMDTMISKQSRTTVAESTVWRPVQDVTATSAIRARAVPASKSCSISVRCRCCNTAACWSSSSPATCSTRVVGWLTRHYTDLRIYRAVETQFKQVVIFGRRVRQRELAPDGVKAVRNLLLQVGLSEVEAEELPSEWPFLPYIVPASPAEPEHFFRVTMEPEQRVDEVGRLQGLAVAGHALGDRAAVAASTGAGLVPLASRPGSGRGRDLRRRALPDGARARRQVTPTRTRRSSGNSPNAKTAPSPRHASSPTSSCLSSARGT